MNFMTISKPTLFSEGEQLIGITDLSDIIHLFLHIYTSSAVKIYNIGLCS